MKQHLLAEQLQEISYEKRIILLSLVLGLEKGYLSEEYEKGQKDELTLLRSYAYKVNVGELLELVEVYAGKFPVPTIKGDTYSINVTFKDNDGEEVVADSDFHTSYVDALYEIVKKLLNKNVIV